MQLATCVIEFRGGPLDGFRYSAGCSYDLLRSTSVLPINSNVISMVSERRCNMPARPASCAAIYALDEVPAEDGAYCYEFLMAADPAEFDLDDWRG